MTKRRAIDAAAVLIVGWVAGFTVYSSVVGRVVFVIVWMLFVVAIAVVTRWWLARAR